MEKEIIKIDGLFKEFISQDKSTKTEVLKGINVSINEGDFVVIYGPSGCGKSTLLNHIVGLETPTKGNVYLYEKNMNTLNAAQRAKVRSSKFGIVYQQSYWAKALNVVENVAVPLMIVGSGYKDSLFKAQAILGEVEMGQYAEKWPLQLSGGEQQRIGLARALVNNPSIIVADEPTGNLDTHSADYVMDLLQKLNKIYKRTVIMVTHNLAYLPLATKTIAMLDGRIVSEKKGELRAQLEGELKNLEKMI
ncbi:MAG: ABC transporter ATP-binding protein [Candidatus Berkelbacteria bacterium]|jgi:putative ABC transport system ATP-binding protein|nr:ABC transporter ATP-binding protein [Candidatus Berkelbacteria bacterium]